MSNFLIGSTGFVGSNLLQQFSFDEFLSSKNIRSFKGVNVEQAIIAAGDARKWFANQNPEEDRSHINRLISDISAINIRKIILFSTVDVFGTKEGDEEALKWQTPSDVYGANRLYLENRIKEICKNVTIIRLPGLYGPGLKKNLIYDISCGRELLGFNPRSTFQWFDLLDLKTVLDFVENENIRSLNVCSEPISVAELLQFLELDLSRTSELSPLVQYDIKTKNAGSFNGGKMYMYEKRNTLLRIQKFLKNNLGFSI
jgi:nucleoside-diphosphate-sugar epimerase